jgi:hypothetical protein
VSSVKVVLKQQGVGSDHAAEEKERSDVESSINGEQQYLEESEYTKDWTDEEEKRVVRKLDATVLFLLVFGFFCFQLERG